MTLLGEGYRQTMEQGGLSNVAGVLQSLDVPSPMPMAAALTAVEFGSGLALILGWHTRPAALALATSQLVANH